MSYSNPTKSVLKPVPESDWIAPNSPRRLLNTFSTSGPTASDPTLTVGANLAHSDKRTWSAANEKVLLGPYDYMLDHPGKDVRKQLIAAFNAWLRVPEESLAIITKVVDMLHTSSLLYAHLVIA